MIQGSTTNFSKNLILRDLIIGPLISSQKQLLIRIKIEQNFPFINQVVNLSNTSLRISWERFSSLEIEINH